MFIRPSFGFRPGRHLAALLLALVSWSTAAPQTAAAGGTPGAGGNTCRAIHPPGIAISGGAGYRDYYRDKKEADPNWKGFSMTPDQDFLIVVGRKPE